MWTAGQALRERALQWPPERAAAAVCGITADEVRGLARDYGSTRPAAIRLNYGMQRVHGGGNAVRLVALLPCLVGAWRHRAGGLLLSARAGSSRSRATPAAAARPAGRPPPAHHQHGAPSATTCCARRRPPSGPRVEAVVVYNSNPVAVAPDSAPGGARLRARRPLHRGAGALPHRHRRPRRLRAAGHHAAGALGRAHHLRPHLRAAQPAGHRAAGAGAVQRRDLPRAGRAHGLHEPCFADSDEALARQAFDPEPWHDRPLRQRAAGPLPLPERPLPTAAFPTPSGRRWSTRRAWACPTSCPTTNVPQSAPAAGRALPAGDDLAAGAALPQLAASST
jgi:hypothetical protein